MNIAEDRKALINTLRKNILQWEGYTLPPSGTKGAMGLGPMETAFPNGVFPLGTVHEFICSTIEQATASCGLIAGLLSLLMQQRGTCLWISLGNHSFPPALKAFGAEAHRIIFVRVIKDREALWVMEESLKCTGLAAVVAEVCELDFKASRRLQLAVEQSHVTGFILRQQPKKTGSTACAARWQVSPLPSQPVDGLPGLGFPRWKIDLLSVRNGRPGSWTMEWSEGKFKAVEEQKTVPGQQQKVG